MCAAFFVRCSLLLGLALLLAAPAAAQDWNQPWDDPLDRPARVDVGVSTGFLMPTGWSDLVLLGTLSPAFGILEQVLVRDMRVEPGAEFGGSLTYWRGRYGFRADVGFTDSSVVIGGVGLEPPDSVDVRAWLYGVRGKIGFIEYTPRRWIWPYGFVGFGGITYDLAERVSPPLLTVIEHDRPGAADADLFVVADGREFILAVNDLGLETVFALNFGVGTDIRIPAGPAGVGVRLEVSNHVAPSPLRVRVRELGAAPAADVGFGAVHHLRATAGLVVRIGR